MRFLTTPVERALAACAAGLVAGLSAWPAHAEPGGARGVIVRLHSAPSHAQLAATMGDARERRMAVAAREQEQQRWQRVLKEEGLERAQLRAVGADQHVLDVGRRMGPLEAAALAARLARRSDVAWAEPNTRERRLQRVPNDPYFTGTANKQWWLHPYGGSNADAMGLRLRGVPDVQTAWGRSTGSAAALVAVLDTGRTDHPELAGRWIGGYDFVADVAFANDGHGRDADPADPGDWVGSEEAGRGDFADCATEPSSWHGTIIAAMIAAQTDNGAGVAGINWNGRILPVRVAGKCGADLADIVDGIRWAAGLSVAGVPDNPNPARVINISFGGSAACGSAYQAAIDEVRALKGAVVVAAAGNEWNTPSRPASCVGAVGVASLNRDGFKTNYSNFGSALSASGIATVGGDDDDGQWGPRLADSGLLTAYNTGTRGPGLHDYASLFGTSFSTPIVSGAISLMLSVNPALTYEQILTGLRLSARPHVLVPKMGSCGNANPGRCACTTATCGVGILDVDQALAYAAAPGSYVAPVRAAAVVDNADIDAAVALGKDRPANPEPPPEPVKSGGGASSGLGLAGLALAVGVLAALRRRKRYFTQA